MLKTTKFTIRKIKLIKLLLGKNPLPFLIPMSKVDFAPSTITSSLLMFTILIMMGDSEIYVLVKVQPLVGLNIHIEIHKFF